MNVNQLIGGAAIASGVVLGGFTAHEALTDQASTTGTVSGAGYSVGIAGMGAAMLLSGRASQAATAVSLLGIGTYAAAALIDA